jgi:hypothetical protein
MRRLINGFMLVTAAGIACISAAGTFAKDKPIPWKGIDDALLRVNEAPVKDWGVYQTGKKRDPLLIQMDNRFFLIKVHDHQLFEVDPGKVQRKSDQLLWDPADHPAQPLETSDWDASDTEAVFRIRAKINTEDRLLDIELPHPLDLSGMSPHSAPATRRR